jgi:hypothetical protein
MDINRDNYETYFLDFVEGRMTTLQEEMLRRFLRFNPDLAEELDSFKVMETEPDSIEYSDKSRLKNQFPTGSESVSEANFNMYAIGYLEDDLSIVQREIFDNYLDKHLEARKQFTIFRKVILEKEMISFPNKKQLKRHRIKFFDWRIITTSAAAVAAFLILLIYPVNQESAEMAIVTVPNFGEESVNQLATDQKPSSEQSTATFNVLRKESSPVPVSSYKVNKKREEADKKNETTKTVSQESKQITGLTIQQKKYPAVPITYDRISFEATPPVTVNYSSLSVMDQARYRLNKVYNVIEVEDALLLSLVSSGIDELSRIRNSETELLASRDEEGSISGIKFKSRYLNVSLPLNRDED